MKPARQRAVALYYDDQQAPVVVAKGEDAVAEQIIALGEQHGVLVHEDRVLADLLSRIDLDEEIPRLLYVAVAEVISFAYHLKGMTPPPREPHPATRPGNGTLIDSSDEDRDG